MRGVGKPGVENRVDESFGLGARDQNIGAHLELEPAERGDARQVLEGDPFLPSGQELGQAARRVGGGDVRLVRDHAAAVGAQDQGHEGDRFPSRLGNLRLAQPPVGFFQEFRDGATRRSRHALISSLSR
jgi:hypothetical protein